MIQVISSNRTKILAQQLALDLHVERSLFDDDMVIVQSQGMAKWLQLELTNLFSICTGVSFPFPKAFIAQILFKCGLMKDTTPYNRENLQWAIFELMPQLQKHHPILNNYVQDREDSLHRQYQLSAKCSELFDNYLVYRKHWLDAWDDEKIPEGLDHPHEAWQRELWRELGLGVQDSFTGAMDAFIHHPENFKEQLKDLRPIHLFAISSLAPMQIAFFKALAEIVDVRIYLTTPCSGYWADVSRKKLFESFDAGSHPLVSSWGTLGKHFQSNLMSQELLDSAEEFIDDIHGDGLLQKVQRSILHLEPQIEDLPKARLLDNIEIHNAHSPKRELEILMDRIYDKLAQNEWATDDIVVMCPDLESYLPFIQSVFGEHKRGMPQLRYSIADRSTSDSSLVGELLNQLFALSQGRFTVSEIMAIIQNPVCAEHHRFSVEDLDVMREFSSRSGFRWGYDGQHRGEIISTEFNEHSWALAKERLMLGVCFDDEEFHDGNIPEIIEEQDMALIGPYFDLVEKLWKFYRFCLENHSYKEWLKACHDMMQNFFENAKGHEENNAKLSKAIVELGDIWSSTQLTQPMSANMIRQSLVQMMDKEVGAMGFLQGGITFCKLLPMRNIPIKMACILGLGAMDFPRQHSQAGMDLMGTKFELGDRSARLDDRYLFLETLMSTTDHLHLSYVGQSISDGSTCPPSVVVSELIDFIKNQNGELPIHRHPLQPFSLKYFDGSFPTQSYSLPNLMAAKAMCEESEPLAFYVEELPPVPFEEGELTITCQDLIRFFQHPCRAFVQRRLGIHTYGESYDLLQDSEPFDLGDQLEQYSLKADIYDMLERNESNIAKRLQAKGVGSYGQKGIDELENLIAEVNQILKKVKTIAQNQPEILPVHIRLKCEQGTVVIRDELDQIYGKTQLLKKVGSIKPKEILRALIHHVILNTAQKDHQTTLIGLNNTSIVEQQFIGGADSHDLKTMVEWYLKGLQRPLPFLPDHSLGHKKVRGKSHLSLEKGAERYDEEMEYPDEIYNTCISVGKDVAIRSEQQQLSDSLVDFFIDMFERNSVDG